MRNYTVIFIALGVSSFVALKYLAAGLVGLQAQSLESFTFEYAIILAVTGLILGIFGSSKMGVLITIPLLPLVGVSMLFVWGALEKGEIRNLFPALHPLIVGFVFCISIILSGFCARKIFH